MNVTRQQVYIAFVGTLGLAIIVGGLVTPIADPVALAIFCSLVAAAELTTSTLSGQSSVSIASAVAFAAALLFSPLHAGLVGAVGGATASVSHARHKRHTRRRTFEVVAFNTGMAAVSTLAGAIVFQATRGGPLIGAPVLADLPPLIVAALVDDLVNALALVVMITIQSGQTPFAVWRENFAWAAPMNVATMAIGGGALATGFVALGVTGLLVFFLPVFLSAYAFRAYITRTQAVMAHLEETVQARTADLAKANESLRELNEQKDAFFAVITHDMRSPLTSMLGFSVLLEREPGLRDDLRSWVAAIHRNTDTLIGMVSDILDLAKLDSGMMEYQREPVNLTLIVSDVLLNMNAQALTRAIDLHSQLEPTPTLIGDDQKLRRVATNLISNAIKYTREHGRVRVQVHAVDSAVRLLVSDTGIGIPSEELSHIFERFRRVRRPGGQDSVGTGLGLSIVNEFVQAHGGHIDVESQEGAGSTFTVHLPVAYTPPPTSG